MKTSLLCLFFALVSVATVSAQIAAPSPTTPAPAEPSDAQQARMEKFKAALDKLDLTDDQRTKIQGIRSTVTDKKERRQQIMAVLTPDQKEKLKEMFKERRAAMQSGTASGAAQ